MNLYLVGKHVLRERWEDNHLDLPLYRRLAKAADTVHLIAQGTGDRQVSFRHGNVRYHLIPPTRCNTIHFAWRAFRLLCRLHRHDPASVVGASEPFGAGTATWWFRLHAGTPVLQMVQGNLFDLPPRHFPAWRRWLIAHLAAFFARRSDAVRAVSRKIASGLRHNGVSPGKILLLPNRVDTRRFDPVALAPERRRLRTRAGWGDDTTVLLWLGMFTVEKGFRDFVAGARRILTETATAAAYLIGSGPLEDEAITLEREFPGRVIRAGFVLHSEVHRHLAVGDLLCFCSHHEGMPRVVLEYMAMGRAIVSTPVGGIAEALEDGRTGHLFPVGDVDAFVDRCRRILATPDRGRSLGSAARRKVIIDHDLDRTIALQIRAYRLLAEKKG